MKALRGVAVKLWGKEASHSSCATAEAVALLA